MSSRKEIVEIFWNVPLPKVTEVLPSGCAVCGKDASRICPRCKAISYCGEDHRHAHHKRHRFICKAIQKERKTREASEMYDVPDNDEEPGNRVQIADPLLLIRIHSLASVEAQIRFYNKLNYLYLDPDFQVECGILPLLTRVNRDQEMYGLIKGLFILRYIDESFKDADVLEPMDFYHESGKRKEVFELVLNLALIKAKLLLDMKRIHAAMGVLAQRLPRELVELVLPGIPQSPTLRARLTRMSTEGVLSEVEKLSGQFDCLYHDLNKLRPYFWPKLASHKLSDRVLEPQDLHDCRDHTMLETQRIFVRHVYAWFEIPGAIALIGEKCRSENAITH